MSFNRLRRALVATGLAAAVAGTTLVPSTAAAPVATPVAKNLFSPLSVAVGGDGTLYYTENFAGKLWMKKPGKPRKVLYSAPEAEVGGVSVEGKAVYFIRNAKVMKKVGSNRAKLLADLGAYEAARNPDKDVRYGAVGLSPECADSWPTGEGSLPLSYTGIVESHPYATAVHKGVVYVADAAANAVFRIRDGKVSTTVLLPAVPVKITPEVAEEAGLPDCAIGATYRFEGVPTDVEVHDRKLYISGLPGGPEDGTAPGSVYRYDLVKKTRKKILTDLVAATGVGVGPDGSVYVSELFAGKVTRLSPTGHRSTFRRMVLPAAVEVARGRLWVTENVLSGFEPGEAPAGKVVRYTR